MGTKLTDQHLIVMAPQISVPHTVFCVCLKTPSLAPALLLSSSLITTSEQQKHQNQFSVIQKTWKEL